jgi:predicted amidophosphoribosyltransferase
MSGSGLGLSGERGFARCPKCQQLIDASVEVCRFCGYTLDREELRKAAALQREVTESIAKANNRRAFIASAIGLAGSVLGFAAWFLARYWGRSRRFEAR